MTSSTTQSRFASALSMAMAMIYSRHKNHVQLFHEAFGRRAVDHVAMVDTRITLLTIARKYCFEFYIQRPYWFLRRNTPPLWNLEVVLT